MLRRPCTCAPFEQSCVQVIRRIPPNGAASRRRSKRSLEGCNRKTLDQWEELPLLEPDMRFELLTELAHRPTHISIDLECSSECVQALVVE